MAEDERPRPTPVAVRIKLTYPEPPARLEAISVAKFSHVGTQIYLDLGVVDDQQLIQVLSERTGDEELPEVNAFIVHRFAMGFDTFQALKRNLEEIVAKMRKAGHLDPTWAEETE